MEHVSDQPTASLPPFFNLPANGSGAAADLLLNNTQRLASIGALTACVAHELMDQLAILTAACGSLQAAALAETADAAAIARYTALIEEQAFRSAHLVRMLQNFGAVGVSRPAVTSVRAILRDTLALVERHYAQEASVQIRVNWSATGRSIVCDHSAIVQLMVNLLANARDALASEGGIVEVGCLCRAADTIAPPAPEWPTMAPDEIAFYVRDDGPGIPTALLDVIFTPFFSTKAGSGHTGLGLTTARQIAGEHNGRLLALNNVPPAHGATFVAILPALPQSS